ncbi:MAG: hypothetical protein O3A00_00075 [Planctomycetota bacterium]|nr:hypothetical protein [Planctomycetota bacterium]
MESRILLSAANPLDLSTLDGVNGSRIQNSEFGLGSPISTAGDVNGDGFGDVIVESFNGVHVVFGDANGLGASIDTSNLAVADGFTILNANADDLATADINGDGLSDIVIGQPFGSNEGRAVVVFGKSTPFAATLDVNAITAADGFFINGETANSRFARSVASAGDVNADGFEDLMLGSQDATATVTIVFGSDAGFGTAFDIANIDGTNGFHVRSELNSPFSAISSAGDFNGDGTDDIVFSRIGAGSFVFGRTTAFPDVINVGSFGSLTGDLDGTTGFRTSLPTNIGFSVASAGDVNGDGFDDVLFGTSNASAGVSLLFGSSAERSNFEFFPANNAAAAIQLTTPASEQLGFAVAGIGDVNGDSLSDFALGAPTGGRVYTVFGSTTAFPVAFDLSTLDGDNSFRADSADGSVGRELAPAVDVNGDGFDDFLLGTSGNAYVVHGGNFTDSVTHLGDGDSNVLTGNANANILNGAQADDLLIGNGGADVFKGGAGDDTFSVPDLNFARIEGDNGTDRLSFTGTSLTLDLTNGVFGRLDSVEAIALTGGGDNTLIITDQQVLGLSPESNSVTVLGNAGDVVHRGTGWTPGEVVDIGGQQFRVYSQGSAELLIQVGVATDELEPPSDIVLSANYINESRAEGSQIATLSAVDGNNGETHTFESLDDAGGVFSVSGDRLVLADASGLDKETGPASYTIRLRATDNNGLPRDKTVTIEVVDSFLDDSFDFGNLHATNGFSFKGEDGSGTGTTMSEGDVKTTASPIW